MTQWNAYLKHAKHFLGYIASIIVGYINHLRQYFWQSRVGVWLSQLNLEILAYRYISVFFALFLLAILHIGWLKLPLTEGWQGSNISLGSINLPISSFVVACYALGLFTIFYGHKVGLFLLMIPPTLLLCWPIISVIEPTGVFPVYFEEARNRAIIDRVFRLQNQLNINIQPTYTPIFDTNSLWTQIKSIFASLSLGWYLFCALGLMFPAVANRGCKKRDGLLSSYCCLPFALVIVFYQLPRNDHYDFPANSAGSYSFGETLQRCRERLKNNFDIAHSDFFVTRCAEAYNSFHGWSGPVAQIPMINQFMGNRGFLNVGPKRHDRLEASLLPILHIDTDDPLHKAFYIYAKRHYLLLQKIKAVHALQEEKFHEAASNISNLKHDDRGPAAWVLHGYAAAQLGQTEVAISSFNRAILMLGDKTVIASIYCSIGDSLVNAGRLAQARSFYRSCKEQDPEQNYWAISGLGGI